MHRKDHHIKLYLLGAVGGGNKNDLLTYSKQRATAQKLPNKPVGDCISAPSLNFVAMATRVDPTTFCMVPLNRPSPKIP